MHAENVGIDERLFTYIVDSIAATPYYNLLGFKIVKVGLGTAEMMVEVNSGHTNPLGAVHGGLLLSLADAAMGNAIRSTGINALTVDYSTALIAGAMPGESIIAKAKVLKTGKNMVFAQAEVWAGKRLLANSKATFFKAGDIEYH